MKPFAPLCAGRARNCTPKAFQWTVSRGVYEFPGCTGNTRCPGKNSGLRRRRGFGLSARGDRRFLRTRETRTDRLKVCATATQLKLLSWRQAKACSAQYLREPWGSRWADRGGYPGLRGGEQPSRNESRDTWHEVQPVSTGFHLIQPGISIPGGTGGEKAG